MRSFHLHLLCITLSIVSIADAQVPPPGTLANPPAGFTIRSATAPLSGMVKLAQDPTTRNIYALGHAPGARVYRVDTAGASITFAQITAANDKVANSQGMTFDRFGNIYLVGQVDKIVKGVPSGGSFTFSDFLVFNNPATEHGMGGLVVGPDDKLYFSNGAETSNGPAHTTIRFGVNVEAKILRKNIDNSGSLEIFASGNRNHFGMVFRSDGVLFGVENGPKANCSSGGLDYGEEFNRIDQDSNLGFPDKYGDHISGSDGSLNCGTTADIPGLTAAWRNNGPNGKPAAFSTYYSFDPHSAAEGISFYDTSQMNPSSAVLKFPTAFNGRAFVARFGQLESGIPDRGFDVLSLALDNATNSFACNAFLTNVPRPIDVLCAYNGKLYILTYDSTTTGSALGGNGHLYEVSYTLVPSDFDRDGDVDVDDLAHFLGCAQGADVALDPSCQDIDLDHDNDGDSSDFGSFQRCFSGANLPANPNCVS